MVQGELKNFGGHVPHALYFPRLWVKFAYLQFEKMATSPLRTVYFHTVTHCVFKLLLVLIYVTHHCLPVLKSQLHSEVHGLFAKFPVGDPVEG